jgi:hypothetical protein
VWDGYGNAIPAQVQMKGAVDFDVVWPEGPPGKEALLVLPRLPFALYQYAFESPGAKVIDRRNRTAFAPLQVKEGRTPFRYTLVFEKIGLLAFVILTGLLLILYRLTPMRVVRSARR